jgi:hypothetical protein
MLMRGRSVSRSPQPRSIAGVGAQCNPAAAVASKLRQQVTPNCALRHILVGVSRANCSRGDVIGKEVCVVSVTEETKAALRGLFGNAPPLGLGIAVILNVAWVGLLVTSSSSLCRETELASQRCRRRYSFAARRTAMAITPMNAPKIDPSKKPTAKVKRISSTKIVGPFGERLVLLAWKYLRTNLPSRL